MLCQAAKFSGSLHTLKATYVLQATSHFNKKLGHKATMSLIKRIGFLKAKNMHSNQIAIKIHRKYQI